MATTTCEGSFKMSDEEFDLLRAHVYRHVGIALGPHKREMLKARLSRRLRVLGLHSFADYYQHLTQYDHDGSEQRCFINAVTTNVTGFFREEHHFQHLTNSHLPALRERALTTGRRRLRFWSAGCSTGEEPYTLALTLREFLGAAAPVWDVRILASDIDTDVLARAETGIYSAERVATMSPAMRSRYFLRGKGDREGLVRVRPELEEWVAFRHINLTEDPWPIRTRFDAIFCRNVLIYFDRAHQRRLIDRFVALLEPGGLLFLGHSESLHGQIPGLRHIANTIYRLTDKGTDA